MNAANAIDRAAADEAVAAQQRAAEPSMEEILASIRRIIADDDVLPPAARVEPKHTEAAVAAAVPAASSPALTLVTPAPARGLQETLAAAHGAKHDAPEDEADISAVFGGEAESGEPQSEPEQQEPAYDPRHYAAHYEAAPLVSADTSVAVHASFESLAATVMAQNSVMVEEAVRSMLRPMLKSWLDDNLPVIVEKLVRAEIERVARGGR